MRAPTTIGLYHLATGVRYGTCRDELSRPLCSVQAAELCGSSPFHAPAAIIGPRLGGASPRGLGTDQRAQLRPLPRDPARAAIQLRDEPVAVAAVDRAHVLDDLAVLGSASCARRGTRANAAGRRAPPTPPRSSPSARSSGARRRSRSRTGRGGARRRMPLEVVRRAGRVRATPARAESRSPSSRDRPAGAAVTITTGSDGETCRRRPRCAPAGATRELERAARRHHAAPRMSSVNEVIVSSWAIFGSLTNVPLPRRRTR